MTDSVEEAAFPTRTVQFRDRSADIYAPVKKDLKIVT